MAVLVHLILKYIVISTYYFVKGKRHNIWNDNKNNIKSKKVAEKINSSDNYADCGLQNE